MKHFLATILILVLIFVAVLNETMITEIEHYGNYSYTPTLWQEINVPNMECPKADVYYQCYIEEK